MIVFPNAKINIGLNIVEKRRDNFHNIETVFYPIGLSDILEAVENIGGREIKFRSSGIKIPGIPGENICMKAYNIIRKDHTIPPLKIHLHKIIPIGAGLGGGSSDAAHFIHLLNDLYSLKMPQRKKLDYAKQLGSDCSFFIKNQPVFAWGRGEKMENIFLRLYGHHLVLICPPVHVSTQEAYAGVSPQKPEKPLKKMIDLPVGEWKENILNQFEASVFKKFPGIGKIKNQLYKMGALYASMSGSGSSVYGIFESRPNEINLKKEFGNCFIWVEKMK